MSKPWLFIIAGPNGAGKTSVVSRKINIPSIDPDRKAKEISPNFPQNAALKAGKQSLQEIQRLIKENQSFAIETTLSGKMHIKLMEKIKEKGWNIGFAYVGLDSPEISIRRVRERTQKGGHFVPDEDVRRRYARGLKNLKKAYDLADYVLIFNNSGNYGKGELLLLKNQETLDLKRDTLPKWIRNNLPEETIGYGTEE